jgi:hypothetical protein
MEVISAELAQQMVQESKFLVHQTVMGHTYGITAAAVRKLQASGKLPVLDLDRVADVTKLKESGFQVSGMCCASESCMCRLFTPQRAAAWAALLNNQDACH